MTVLKDGRILSGSNDKTMRTWKLTTGGSGTDVIDTDHRHTLVSIKK